MTARQLIDYGGEGELTWGILALAPWARSARPNRSRDFVELALHLGGEGEIRTHEPLAGLPVFKTGAFNRSATSPISSASTACTTLCLIPMPFSGVHVSPSATLTSLAISCVASFRHIVFEIAS